METTVSFLERLRASIGADSGCTDYRLGKVLQVSHSSITNYLKRGRTMDDDVALKVADLLGIDPAYVLACVHAERSTSVESAKVWERIAAKFAA
jgi:predicted transcriptional regulator